MSLPQKYHAEFSICFLSPARETCRFLVTQNLRGPHTLSFLAVLGSQQTHSGLDPFFTKLRIAVCPFLRKGGRGKYEYPKEGKRTKPLDNVSTVRQRRLPTLWFWLVSVNIKTSHFFCSPYRRFFKPATLNPHLQPNQNNHPSHIPSVL